MQIKYTVSSCTQDEVTVKAIVAGQEVDAKIPGLVVEATSVDGGMGHTFRLTPIDMTEAMAMFTTGAEITLTFSPTLAS